MEIKQLRKDEKIKQLKERLAKTKAVLDGNTDNDFNYDSPDDNSDNNSDVNYNTEIDSSDEKVSHHTSNNNNAQQKTSQYVSSEFYAIQIMIPQITKIAPKTSVMISLQ